MNESICANCGAVLAGEYCAACGQRRFRPRDRRMAHLLGESFDALTDFDGRIWRSLRAALLQPGRIARDWIEGRRARWTAGSMWKCGRSRSSKRIFSISR